MRRVALTGAMLLVVSACGTDAAPQDAVNQPAPLTATADVAPPSAAASSLCSRVDGSSCVFDAENFDEPTVIDNRWLPMRPGAQLVYRGTTNEDDELLDHQVIITVTDLVKVINGIETVVSWDLDFSDGELVEAELAFFAQDNDGNVWRMGEHPEEYEDGELVEAPTWIAGINDAEAGITMLADPVVGTLSYSQGWAPEVDFIDRGRVEEVGEPACVEFDCFDNVLIIAEFNVVEAGASQLKYFARGIGNVAVGWSGTDETQEELELVSVEQLDATALVDVNAAALELETHAYQVSPNVYGLTEPAVNATVLAASSLCSRVDGSSCVFDAENFDEPTVIDNRWLPMRPGAQLVYRGTTNEDDELLDHQVIITVTDLVKVINGIETVVSWDLDFSDGELVEAELAFFAQDNDGNVWRMGEHPEEYEDGELVEAPTWIAGINDAEAGITMLADPVVGTLSYSQGWAPEVDFIDRGRVEEVGEPACVEFDCFDNVLIIAEFNVVEAGASQLKYFARGIGNVAVGWSGTDETQEELELVSVEQLDATALVDVNAAALELETHAYQVSPNVYGLTEPAVNATVLAASSLCSRVDGSSCVFDAENFDEPTVIDNRWLPMRPGAQLVYRGTTNEDDELLDHQVIITVTDLVKVINGIETVVSWDLDFSDGELVEAELAFFAQDNDGNVWRMGEHPEEYEDGELVEAPTWIAGINDAEAGITMLADPVVGTLSYSQGWAPEVDFIDRGRVEEVGEPACVEFDCFDNVLIIAEFNVVEAGASQLKYFARGIGNVAVGWSGTDETQEELELVSVEQLDATALVDVNAAALELETHAYQVSPNVYGLTEPALPAT